MFYKIELNKNLQESELPEILSDANSALEIIGIEITNKSLNKNTLEGTIKFSKKGKFSFFLKASELLVKDMLLQKYSIELINLTISEDESNPSNFNFAELGGGFAN